MTDDPIVSTMSPRGGAARHWGNLVERVLHAVGYYLLLRRQGTRLARIAGLRLTIRPTVYDPRYYRAPAYFAEFIGGLELSGKIVADLGTGSGLQALAAARAGARRVVAIDVNPNAALTAADNARANGFGNRVLALASNLFTAIAPGPHFDVIVANLPFCAAEAWDLADRAWRAGAEYRDIASIFEQAHERLAPGGVVYLIMSSLSDLAVLGDLIRRAGFRAQIAARRAVFLEALIIYELRAEAAERAP
jgi:release factor glutamine methyltransferase